MIETSSNSWLRKFGKYLFWIAVIALVAFNARVTFVTSRLSHSSRMKHLEVDMRRTQSKELVSIYDRYVADSYAKITEMESRLKEMHEYLSDEDEPFPILDREFAVTSVDGPFQSGQRTIHLTVPRDGQHRLRIQATHKDDHFFDRQFDLVSGRGYQIRFILADNKFQMFFPSEESVNIELNDFVSDNHIADLRSSIFGRSTFISCNQPRWTLESWLDTAERGVITQFAYLSESYATGDDVSIKITADSDGPPVVAADDPATVQHLTGLLGTKFESGFRYEDGWYVFE